MIKALWKTRRTYLVTITVLTLVTGFLAAVTLATAMGVRSTTVLVIGLPAGTLVCGIIALMLAIFFGASIAWPETVKHSNFEFTKTNPATGMSMTMGGVDIAGNPYGVAPRHDD